MLLANLAAAKRIFTYFPTGAILRKHSPPFARRLSAFVEFMSRYGYPMVASSSASLQTSLDRIEDPDISMVRKHDTRNRTIIIFVHIASPSLNMYLGCPSFG
jgi:exoribonuclease R